MIKEVAEIEHMEISGRLSGFRDSILQNSVNLELFNSFRTRLRNHMFAEEEILFPAIMDEERVKSASGMEYEHAAIWMLVKKIETGIRSSDLNYTLKNTESMGRLIVAHGRREEELIYGFADFSMSGDEVAYIAERMKMALAPEGWICRFFVKHDRHISGADD